MAMIKVYGIANCDTVKKARAWLTAQGQTHEFHDFKKHGVLAQELAQWVDAVGWQKLLNHQGTTWRKLDSSAQTSVTDALTAQVLMQLQPSIIKRPVVQWPATRGQHAAVTVGFDAAAWTRSLAAENVNSEKRAQQG